MVVKSNFISNNRKWFWKKEQKLDEYRVQNRGGRGVITYKVTPKTGNIVGIRIANGNEDVMLITDTGTIIRLKVKEISVLGKSNTRGYIYENK